jgi:cell division protein FtsX
MKFWRNKKMKEVIIFTILFTLTILALCFLVIYEIEKCENETKSETEFRKCINL